MRSEIQRGGVAELADASRPVALVVILHGCTQTAAGYDAAAGWSKLADEFGFAVLFPEQTRQNNPNLCFNWFSDSDIQRDRGEVRSIREMIDEMVSSHGVDPTRVSVTGLSAGGAMANAMLTAYPEVFAGGAIIAGLPYGVASSIPQAFDRMRDHGLPSREQLQERLRSGSSHAGRGLPSSSGMVRPTRPWTSSMLGPSSTSGKLYTR